MVSIAGLDKAEVIAALYNAFHAQGMGWLHYDATPMTAQKGAQLIAQQGDDLYFDYLSGRVIKVDLNGDEFDPRLYDRDHYPGAAQKVINSIVDRTNMVCDYDKHGCPRVD